MLSLLDRRLFVVVMVGCSSVHRLDLLPQSLPDSMDVGVIFVGRALLQGSQHALWCRANGWPTPVLVGPHHLNNPAYLSNCS